MRKDIDPGSYGRVAVEEIRGSQSAGEDILLLAKKFMADPEPYRVVTVLTAEQAAILRRSFQQPSGVWRRRLISDKVRKKVLSKVPACIQQGLISHEAGAYLTNWVGGLLPRLARPQRYSFLAHRSGPADGPGQTMAWQARGRERHVDLSIAEDDDGDSGSDEAYQPIEDE